MIRLQNKYSKTIKEFNSKGDLINHIYSHEFFEHDWEDILDYQKSWNIKGGSDINLGKWSIYHLVHYFISYYDIIKK